jgi:hypothetical protein
MRAVIQKLQFPIILFLLAVLSYGLMIPFLGIYSDDWTFLWITQRFGISALMFHYLTNRPFLWFISAPMMVIIGNSPWKYVVLFILARIAGALSIHWLLKLVWPQNKTLGVLAALIFLLYPGYTVWPEAILSSRHMILFLMVFCSFSFSLLSVHKVEHRRLWMALAITLGVLNQLVSDYFLCLEFIRPFLIFFSYSDGNISSKQKMRQIMYQCGPLWIVFCLVMYWRLFCFPNLESWYRIDFFSNLQQAPLPFLMGCIEQILRDLWTVLGPGMLGLFGIPHISSEGRPVLIMFAAGILAAGLIVLSRRRLFPDWDQTNRKGNYSVIIIGFLLMVFAGPVFWVVGIPLSINFSGTRFILPFLAGACLIFAGLINLLPAKRIMVAAVALWVGVAVAANLRTANFYRNDWTIQQRLLTEITLRIPDIESGTMVVSEEIPTILPSSTFLSAYLNWVYAQDSYGFPGAEYFFAYIAHDSGDVTPENIQTSYNILNAYPFRGSSSHILGLTYINDCLVVLDPQIDIVNPYIAANIQQLSAFAHPDQILPNRVPIPSDLVGVQNDGSIFPWCLSFLEADLAGQYKQWETVTQIADASLSEFPQTSSMGRFFVVFIEGFAFTGRLSDAVDLTSQTINFDPATNEMMCRVWDRIILETPDELWGEYTPTGIRSLFHCD